VAETKMGKIGLWQYTCVKKLSKKKGKTVMGTCDYRVRTD